MTDIKTGGPAFPRSAAEHSQGGHFEQDGMTLRDYFAAKVLQGLLAADEECAFKPDGASEYAYRFADAMIAASEVQP
ncbi:hypothetical protein B3286c1_1767 [Brucella vulpis]|uniref:hypothetical protein n=1 Tax=Brucella vulpis TaxID=981386 RepID=UPI00073A7F47|nr:hypothetical protein BF3285c1_1768 [Brucella vulpis]CUW50568.1 hypothetical protein B3286c1_1767 [Brucella vulpis]